MNRVIMHLDMDAFYASVEQRDHPELKGRPVMVGAAPDRRGVICAASYEARVFGVRSAMPSRTAQQLCPHGVFVRPRMNAYLEESRQIRAILATSGAVVQQVSIDEAYLDLTHLLPDLPADEKVLAARPIGQDLKARILNERQLTATVGLSNNKFMAKLASDFQKPDGFTIVLPSHKIDFLRPLPVDRIHGVGAVTAAALQAAGFQTIADLQDRPDDYPVQLGSFSQTLRLYALGLDDRPVAERASSKSISSETTFVRDTESRPILRNVLRQQAREIADRLQEEGLAAKGVRVKVRYSDFTTLTRQQSFPEAIHDAQEIYRRVCHLLRQHRLVSRPIRLIGAGVIHLSPPSRQLEFDLSKG
jgi:DNA polymerase-4